tara:strand:+ start:5543 stop:5845 length:303 start_codon:yes stop_codon:yes gene_type:complete
MTTEIVVRGGGWLNYSKDCRSATNYLGVTPANRIDYLGFRVVKEKKKKEKKVEYRVIRGGSWYGTTGLCRSAYRDWYSPSYRYNSGGLGFRVIKESKDDN